MKITSNFALLDVKRGRVGLLKKTATHLIPVTIKGFIDDRFGGDDGTSIEFCVDVKKVVLGTPKKKKASE